MALVGFLLILTTNSCSHLILQQTTRFPTKNTQIMPKKYCTCCKRDFSSNRYFLQHLKYPANERCKKSWEKLPVSPDVTPQKRCSDDTQEFRSSPIMRQSEYAGMAFTQLFGFSSNLGEICRNRVMDSQNADNDDGEMGIFGDNDDSND